MKRRLELTWTGKDKSLHYDEQTKAYQWVDKRDPRVSEPRILVKETEVGEYSDNLLIKGDNLLALKALEDDYVGQVQLVYIDPPFNTGAAFENYDDGLEQSVWLTLMRDRISLLHKLLCKEGAIFVEIDDTNIGYMRLLLDEKFGRENFAVQVAIKRSAATGHKAINPGTVNVTEYLVVYAKNKKEWKYNTLTVGRVSYDKQYNKFIRSREGDSWDIASLADVVAESLKLKSAAEARKAIGKERLQEEMERFALANAANVIRMAQPNYEGVSKAAKALIDKSKADPQRVYHLAREDHSDMYFLKGDRILFLQDKVKDVDGETGLAEPLTNFWDDMSWQGIASEGGVVFKKGKKPEKLLRRIIQLGSEPGDLVLDSFLGSGTTAAVAHKMGRRWIGIEFGEQADTHCLPRLSRVVSGEDQTGISKVEGWKGGGGFIYCRLGQSLFKHDDELQMLFLNPEFYNGPLIRAISKIEGYKVISTTEPLHAKVGRRYAHITEHFVTQEYVDQLLQYLGPKDSLVVYAKKASSRIEVPDNVEVRTLPAALLKRFKL